MEAQKRGKIEIPEELRELGGSEVLALNYMRYRLEREYKSPTYDLETERSSAIKKMKYVALEKLVGQGFATKEGTEYTITPEGLVAIQGIINTPDLSDHFRRLAEDTTASFEIAAGILRE